MRGKKLIIKGVVMEQYKQEVSKYGKKDTVISLCYFVFYVGILFISVVFRADLYLTAFLWLLPFAVLFGIVLIKKEGFSSIGLGKENFFRSLKTGLFFGILILIAKTVFALLFGYNQFGGIPSIIFDILYSVFIIGFQEEVVCRGYVQTRLYGIFKNDIPAVLVGSLLFVVMHYPVRIFNMGGWHPSLFIGIFTWGIMHVAFNSMFRKYKSVYGVAVFHGLMNSHLIPTESGMVWYSTVAVVSLALLIMFIRSRYIKRFKA
jgi:membrane protease YdiL (CAAX protease family)